jgi:ankyrin repeat protein
VGTLSTLKKLLLCQVPEWDVAVVREALPGVVLVPALLACSGVLGPQPHHALVDAASAGDLAMVERLIGEGVDVNAVDQRTNSTLGIKTGDNALREAAGHGHVPVVRALVAAGADLDQPDHYGWTPLLSAIQEGHADVVEELLRSGANPNKPNSVGRTPIHEASYTRCGIVGQLLEYNADPTIADDDGVTPLTRAERGGDAVCIAHIKDALHGQ